MNAPLTIWCGGILIAAWIALKMLFLSREDRLHGLENQANLEGAVSGLILALGIAWAAIGWLPLQTLADHW